MTDLKVFHLGELCTNCYVLINEGEAVVIDPGYPDPGLLAFVSDPGISVKAVLLTHRHFDHVNAAGKIKKLTGCKIVISDTDECGLYSDEASISALSGFSYGHADEKLRADVLVSDGDTIEFAGFRFGVIAAPGHTSGSVCYLTGDSLFCGDTLFRDSIGRTDFPTGNFDEMIASLKKLKKLPLSTLIYPGHGDGTVLSREAELNPYVRNI